MTKTEIRKLDREFSVYIRKRGFCQRCGKWTNLQTSHIYSRRYQSIRWHPLNAFCFDSGCHFWWHHRPADAVEWAKGFMGEIKWAQLKELSQCIRKDLTIAEVRGWWK